MKIKYSLIFSILLTIFASTAFASHTVTMNVRFHITDINDSIRVNDSSYSDQNDIFEFDNLAKPYIASQRNGTLFAIIADDIAQAVVDTRQDPYLFTVRQNGRQFVLVMTNGTWQTVDSAQRIPATTFGDVPAPSVAPGLALQLRVDTIMTGLLAPGQMLIKSLGTFGTIPRINVDVVG